MNAIKNPERTAVICEDKKQSWSELWQRSNQLANSLLMQGLNKQETVLVYMPNCFEYPEIALAVSKAGLTLAPANFRLTLEEVDFQLNDCGASVAFCKQDQLPVLQAICARGSKLKHIILVEAYSPEEMVSVYEKVLSSGSPADPGVDVKPDEIQCLMYTSGTTGRPKGAVRTYANNYHMAVSASLELRLVNEDVQLAAAPLYAAASLGYLYCTFLSGGTIVVLPSFVPEKVLQAIDKYRPTWMFMVPIMYEWVLSLPEEILRQYNLSSLLKVTACGAPLRTTTMLKMVEIFKFAEVSNWLGASEFGFISKYTLKEGMTKEGSVGKAIFDMELKLLDSQGNEVKRGEVGILYGRGPSVFQGYWGNKQGTVEAFVDHEWVTVGDMARQDEDGYYYLVDRAKDVVISGGTNVYPVEVENVLLEMNGIADVAVIGVPDLQWGEAVKAIVVLAPGVEVTEQEIKDFCRKKLAGFKVPKSVDFIDSIPRSGVGKALKRELRKKYWEGNSINIS